MYPQKCQALRDIINPNGIVKVAQLQHPTHHIHCNGILVKSSIQCNKNLMETIGKLHERER